MDWSLEAVVRGPTHNPTQPEWFDLRVDDHYGYNFEISPLPVNSDYDFREGAKGFDDLEDVYKPFYPGFQCSSSSGSIHETRGFEGREESSSPVAATDDATLVTKVKRRRNQQKRVVKDVTTDGVSLDKWAWRKYGQKPIKGSPYPRSYYRCSSSRVCLARKQVERSISDPNTFNVSYSEEHNHDQPTRRNALAGSTRTKFSTATASTNKSPINSSGLSSPAYSARESDEGKMVNRSSGGGGLGEEDYRFLGFEGIQLW